MPSQPLTFFAIRGTYNEDFWKLAKQSSTEGVERMLIQKFLLRRIIVNWGYNL